MESDICNFADDTTIYACDTSIEAVIIRLESDLHRMLQWFNDNGMKANPSKFQIMFLGQEAVSCFKAVSNEVQYRYRIDEERGWGNYKSTLA